MRVLPGLRLFPCTCLLWLLTSSATAQPPAVLPTLDQIEARYAELARTPHDLTDSERLRQLFELDWQHRLVVSPELATSMGYAGRESQWSDRSAQALERRRQERAWPERVVASIDRDGLSPEDRLNFDLFARDLEMAAAQEPFPGELLAVNQLSGIQQSVPGSLDQMPAETVRDFEHILGRLRGVPTLIEQNLALLQRGLEAGITPPRVVLGEVPQQAQRMIPDDALQSPLLRAFTRIPEHISPAERQRLLDSAIALYREVLVPAYSRLYHFLRDTYLPNARESIGLGALPDGAQWYALNVRNSTTTELTPRQIHELGLTEVARIRQAMDALIIEVGFDGNFADFLHFLATDPRFYYSSEEELLAAYRDIAKRIDPQLPRLFGTLPRLPYGVRALPAYSAPSQPTAFYYSGSVNGHRPGWFSVNTYNLPARPRWQMEALTLHEAVPGHHLQISLAQELESLPAFRRYGGSTAYTEGWALYCEGLGEELGLYTDPYARFGALSFEMWRAVRLVVDTGIHAFGWSRDRAIDYMQTNTGKDRHEATVEIDRYIVWPGQALAYKIGQLKISQLRSEAEKRLGKAFDLRAFHDLLLAQGALPLDVLEALVRDWLERQVVAQDRQLP